MVRMSGPDSSSWVANECHSARRTIGFAMPVAVTANGPTSRSVAGASWATVCYRISFCSNAVKRLPERMGKVGRQVFGACPLREYQ